jgi:hypothetical protein
MSERYKPGDITVTESFVRIYTINGWVVLSEIPTHEEYLQNHHFWKKTDNEPVVLRAADLVKAIRAFKETLA